MGRASRLKQLKRLAAERERALADVITVSEQPEPEPVAPIVTEPEPVDVSPAVPDTEEPKRRPGRPPKTLSTRDGQEETLPEPVGEFGPGLGPSDPQEETVIEADSSVWLTKAVEKHPVKGEGPRGRIAAWLMLRAVEPNITIKDAAEKLGVSRRTLHSDIVKAVEHGWLKFDESMDQIRYQVIPKVIRNLNHFLDEGDRQVTIEAAKGTVFKQFAEAEGLQDNRQTTILALKLELPETPAGEQPLTLTGKIVGQPREID